MTPNTISIIMPTYNGERFVSCALESIRTQQDGNLEVIVVDDGSTDRTLEIVQNFAASLPIRLITPGRIGNWVSTTNLGLREANGEWVCFLHQDDFWMPGRIARLRREMGCGNLIVHNAIFVGPSGEPLGNWTCPFRGGSIPSEQFIDRLLVQNFIAIPSPLFRREAAIDGLDESLWFSADWDLWLRLGAMGPVRFINEPLAAFRIHPESQTASRKIRGGEWEHQLNVVLKRHMSADCRRSVQRAADASVAINAALSDKSRGEPLPWPHLLVGVAPMGPLSWYRYLRDSRILQRVRPRLKMTHQ